jgi:outer membrane protein TolC
MPAEGKSALLEAAVAHPRVETHALLAESQDEHARAARADRYPSVGIGVDWIITGAALDPTMPDSGKDAVVGMAALKIPLSLRAYAAGEEEARARGRMHRAQQMAARNQAVAEFERVMAALRDAIRRVELYERTMIPMAETSFSAVQESYASGRASVSEILMAEREVLELELMALRARAGAANAWAALERVVGRPVKPKEIR